MRIWEQEADMCFRASAFTFSKDINWDGDVVLFDTTVTAMRSLPDVKPRRRYAVDIREFLAMENSSVLHATLSRIANGIPAPERYRFFIKERGAFDFRALHVLHHVCENIRYVRRRSRNFDTWLYPDETLAAGGGDCEDLAFLIAALLLASGISPYMVRVAFGYVRDHHSHGSLHQHAWVMYRAENGAWMLYDPLALRVPEPRVPRDTRVPRVGSGKGDAEAHKRGTGTKSGPPSVRFEYLPVFVMNGDHVWRVESG
ncbi:MAG: transglutaminase-like domain-containing protein, partial [Candidatus Kapaibacterium sp.]